MPKSMVIVIALLCAFLVSFGQSHIVKQGATVKHSISAVGHVPYQVSLQRMTADGKMPMHFCDGVIIRPNWILTSAHCFDSDKSTHFIIRYGVITNDNKGGMTISPDRLFLYPSYRQNYPTDDLALIRTRTSLHLDKDGQAYPIKVATHEVTRGMVNVSDSNSGNMFNSCGPAVQNGQLVGLVCGGVGCGEPGRQGLYTSLANYSSWIDELIELVEQGMINELKI